jgi:hypothetical protein
MQIQEIEIYVDKNGEIHIETKGVAGTTCLDLTAEVEKVLGGRVQSREMKQDLYEEDPQLVRLDVKQQL